MVGKHLPGSLHGVSERLAAGVGVKPTFTIIGFHSPQRAVLRPKAGTGVALLSSSLSHERGSSSEGLGKTFE